MLTALATGGGSSPKTTDPSGNPASNAVIANTSVPVNATGTGSESSFTASNPSTIVLGDMSVYGLPFGSLTFTKTNTGTADLTWGVAANGTFIFQISNTTGTISVTLSATTSAGDVFDGPLAYVTSGGTIQSTAIAADGVFYLYMGR